MAKLAFKPQSYIAKDKNMAYYLKPRPSVSRTQHTVIRTKVPVIESVSFYIQIKASII